MTNHPNRSVRNLIYVWVGKRKDPVYGFVRQKLVRSDGKEVEVSAARLSVLIKQQRLVYP